MIIWVAFVNLAVQFYHDYEKNCFAVFIIVGKISRNLLDIIIRLNDIKRVCTVNSGLTILIIKNVRKFANHVINRLVGKIPRFVQISFLFLNKIFSKKGPKIVRSYRKLRVSPVLHYWLVWISFYQVLQKAFCH